MTTNATNPFVRWIVIIVLGAATAGMVTVALLANYLFGFGFGRTPETAHVFGWANVAADTWKVFGLIVVSSLWRAQQKRVALILMPIWVLCLLWGLAGAIGVYAQDRTALVGTREAASATYKDAEQNVAELDGRLKGLRTHRSSAEVEAAIGNVLARPVIINERIRGSVGKVSANCARPDRLTTEACQEVAALQEELAIAKEAATLETQRSGARQRVQQLRDGGGSLSPDPVAELFAWLSRGQLSMREIGFGFPLVCALLIEIVSAFGPVGIVAYVDATTRRPERVTGSDIARHGQLMPGQASIGEHGRVLNWVADRTEPTSDPSSVAIEDLYIDYEVWCLSTGLNSNSARAFANEFDRMRELPELGGRIRRFGSRYYGIRLTDRKIARLAKRKA